MFIIFILTAILIAILAMKFFRISIVIENKKYIKVNETDIQNIQNKLSQYNRNMTEQELNFLEHIHKKPQIEISYIDGFGNHTNRRVLVLTYSDKLYNGCIIAYCELKKSIRLFRFDRIQKCKDLKTGKEIDLHDHINYLYNFNPEHYLGKICHKISSNYPKIKLD